MGLNDILNIGSTGMQAHRLAIEVTSENVANVNTPGYARQNVIFQTAPTIGTSVRGTFGTGVRVDYIQRAYDGMLQSQIVNGSSTDGSNQAVLDALKTVEPLVNELATSGLGQAIDDFFGAWQDLSLNPAGIPERQAVLTRAQILVDNFHQMNTSLNQAISNTNDSLIGISADISDKAKNIAALNGQINQATLLGGNANELLSQRDYLVKELATKVGITVSPTIMDSTDPSMITIRLIGGETLVEGGNYAEVYAVSDPVNNFLNDIVISTAGNPPSRMQSDATVTDTIGGPVANPNSLGEIGGTLKVRGSLGYPGIIDGYLDSMDELALTIATEVNTFHTAGWNLNGVSGNNFFGTGAISPDAQPLPAAGAGYSGSIQISNDLITGGILDPKKIAAASSAAGVPGDNSTAVSIAGVINTPMVFSSGTMTISAYYNSFVSEVGIDVQGATTSAEQSNAFLKQLNSLWESNSGVSLDEELTNLIRYQKAFEGSAKMITTASEMMDVVIGLVR